MCLVLVFFLGGSTVSSASFGEGNRFLVIGSSTFLVLVILDLDLVGLISASDSEEEEDDDDEEDDNALVVGFSFSSSEESDELAEDEDDAAFITAATFFWSTRVSFSLLLESLDELESLLTGRTLSLATTTGRGSASASDSDSDEDDEDDDDDDDDDDEEAGFKAIDLNGDRKKDQ